MNHYNFGSFLGIIAVNDETSHLEIRKLAAKYHETIIFGKILLQISCFLKLFCTKNAQNDYIDQRLECAAPKGWWKYTTKSCFPDLKNFNFLDKIKP